MTDVSLPELNTALTNFHLQITSGNNNNNDDVVEQDSSSGENNSVEVKFESGRVILKFGNIFIDGSGMIADPETKHLEVITFRAPI